MNLTICSGFSWEILQSLWVAPPYWWGWWEVKLGGSLLSLFFLSFQLVLYQCRTVRIMWKQIEANFDGVKFSDSCITQYSVHPTAGISFVQTLNWLQFKTLLFFKWKRKISRAFGLCQFWWEGEIQSSHLDTPLTSSKWQLWLRHLRVE